MSKRIPRGVVELLAPPGKKPKLAQSSAIIEGFFTSYYRHFGRSFPWRAASVSPFHLLIAELLLVQTKASDVATVWPILIGRYPSPKLLAAAPVRELTHMLRPLGLQRQRARALKFVADALVQKHKSKVPADAEELLMLPHVGVYVAGALRAFALGKRSPIVDANVLRVLGRLTGTDFGKDTRRAPSAWSLAWSILPKGRLVVLHNYGFLDFSAQICTKRPQCDHCGLAQACDFNLRRGPDHPG